MTMTTPAATFPSVGVTDKALANAILAHAAEISNLADSINHLAVAMQATRTPPGASKPPASTMPPMATAPPPSASAGSHPEKTVQQKRGGLIWGMCKDHSQSIEEVGQHVLGRPVGKDARTWPDADQQAVLDAMRDWGWVT